MRSSLLYKCGYNQWRAPLSLLDDPSMLDMCDPEAWQIRDINERIEELREERDAIEQNIDELSTLLRNTYS